jgi:type II secretory pathway component PulJ
MTIEGRSISIKQAVGYLTSAAVVGGVLFTSISIVAGLGGERRSVLNAMQRTEKALSDQAQTDREILVRVRQLEADRERLARIESMQASQDRMLRMLLRSQGIKPERK